MDREYFKGRIRNSMSLHALEKRVDGDSFYKNLDRETELGIIDDYLTAIDSELSQMPLDQLSDAQLTIYVARAAGFLDQKVEKLKP